MYARFELEGPGVIPLSVYDFYFYLEKRQESLDNALCVYADWVHPYATAISALSQSSLCTHSGYSLVFQKQSTASELGCFSAPRTYVRPGENHEGVGYL